MPNCKLIMPQSEIENDPIDILFSDWTVNILWKMIPIEMAMLNKPMRHLFPENTFHCECPNIIMCRYCLHSITIRTLSSNIFRGIMKYCTTEYLCSYDMTHNCQCYIYWYMYIILEYIHKGRISTVLILLDNILYRSADMFEKGLINLLVCEILDSGVYCEFSQLKNSYVYDNIIIRPDDDEIKLFMRNGDHVGVVERTLKYFGDSFRSVGPYGITNKTNLLLIEAVNYGRIKTIIYLLSGERRYTTMTYIKLHCSRNPEIAQNPEIMRLLKLRHQGYIERL